MNAPPPSHAPRSKTATHHSPRLDAEPGTGILAVGLARRFGPVPALDGVDLVAPPGGVTVVLGPNGAGKTTLLRVLATLARPDAGSAQVAGADVRRDPTAVRRRIGFVSHRPLVYLDLTAAENLRFHARLHGTPADPARLAAALDAVGLARRRHRRVRTLSHGMRQRLAIARALWHDPPVLLLDEPHTGLDPAAADWLDATIRAAAADGRTVVLTTHDLDRAHALADHLVILRRGRVAHHAPGHTLTSAEVRSLYEAVTGEGPLPAGTPPAPHRDAPSPGRSAPAPAERARRPVQSAPSTDRVATTDQSFRRAVGPVVWKDLRVELRAREILPPVLVFALLVIVIFQFTLPADTTGGVVGAPGALWIALMFGSTLGLARALGGEIDGGGMTGLLLAPIDRAALFFGKWLSGWLFSLIVAACVLVTSVAWLNVPPDRLPALAGVLALGMAGWVAAGTLLGMVAMNTRAREVLLPVLLYPAVLPLAIPAVRLTGIVMAAGGEGGGTWPLLALVAAFDVIFLVLGFLLFPFVVEE